MIRRIILAAVAAASLAFVVAPVTAAQASPFKTPTGTVSCSSTSAGQLAVTGTASSPVKQVRLALTALFPLPAGTTYTSVATSSGSYAHTYQGLAAGSYEEDVYALQVANTVNQDNPVWLASCTIAVT